MNKKMIALDLDGTLLNNESKLSEKTKKVLKKVMEKGHHVIITTGRPYWMAHEFYKELELHEPMINFNGALTHIPEKKWEFEHSRKIDKDLLVDMIEQADAIEADFIASQYRRKFFIQEQNNFQVNPEFFGVESFPKGSQFQLDKVTKGPNGILLQTRVKNRYDLAHELEKHYQNALSINTWGGPFNILECSAYGVNKAYALNYLLSVYKMDKRDLIAFGDEHNDTEMLEFAGTGYAMKNANPAILEHADKQTALSNDEDGVAHELEKLFLE
ncbi:Cof-type HAD-IIB family hydrolase [Streptococcus massiliensis]|uniref:Putative hydrolase n=1 Tax=Streptococcus massiliensis TaxID=313439 RepID=A0A380KXJ5_9STRE|nr:Cof-type HAD-IIB family hydrolase [Streptococcus massiliensis]SUN76682.1 putative hydrolase [Streptococcus massiliensis]